ncbi:TetR/AcrR family transcriptional regulator [uncultured Erythrobacter sp.]|uniref:TetR/AcrR family transcriptional regulator n=1 Tax=uncultured Erythrobacter sp. TaxID=263913 RepID=UPI002630D56E|nr:TetR/AcrR family transcriptional regulator [uncultured Erythrobacter sp.]
MYAFWQYGFEATSMADLITATGSTRQSIYGDFGNKDGLYRACFDLYRDEIVQPAISPLVDAESGLDSIAEYFETQIARAEAMGLPGPGCLVGNAMTEMAPCDQEIGDLVKQHNDRLTAGFANALPGHLTAAKRQELADFFVIAAQGLWAVSRVTASADELRARVRTILRMIQKEIEDVQ